MGTLSDAFHTSHGTGFVPIVELTTATPAIIAIRVTEWPVMARTFAGAARLDGGSACTAAAVGQQTSGCEHAANGPVLHRPGRCRVLGRRRLPAELSRPSAS